MRRTSMRRRIDKLRSLLPICLTCAASFLLIAVFAAHGLVIVDDGTAEWPMDPVYSDASGDHESGGLDFGRLWIADDRDRVFLSIERGDVGTLHGVVLYIDTDGDAGTGQPIEGIGADFVWDFGQYGGTVGGADAVIEVMQGDVGLVVAPSVTSDRFVVAFSRHATIDDTTLFPMDEFTLVIRDSGPGGDRLPDTGSVQYRFGTNAQADVAMHPLGRMYPDDLRIVSYNMPFHAELAEVYKRVIRAIDPDILCLQEIHDPVEDELVAWMNDLFGGHWEASRVEPDLVVLSRFPISATYSIPGFGYELPQANAAFLIDAPTANAAQVLVVNVHAPCCGYDEDRQLEIDAIMAFVRDAKEPGGRLHVEHGTPIFLVGDMNLVGLRQQQVTLTTGDVVNEDQFGPSFSPDWDETALRDVMPRHIEAPFAYTWRNVKDKYQPGRLDYVVYTDSVIEVLNAYVLDTSTMSPHVLEQAGLSPDDSDVASDHLPLVVDFGVASLRE